MSDRFEGATEPADTGERLVWIETQDGKGWHAGTIVNSDLGDREGTLEDTGQRWRAWE